MDPSIQAWIALAGHVSTPAVSAIVRRAWPKATKRLVAALCAGVAAALVILLTRARWDSFAVLALAAFGVQQASYQAGDTIGPLALAGSPQVNEPLLDASILPG
jgi:ABC-type thiamin/hydroxymethylpyrimidine transport system permease subunit